MDRRNFLKVAGIVIGTGALGKLPTGPEKKQPMVKPVIFFGPYSPYAEGDIVKVTGTKDHDGYYKCVGASGEKPAGWFKKS